jgi:hypothetical protein
VITNSEIHHETELQSNISNRIELLTQQGVS